jgi:hypothetical protein
MTRLRKPIYLLLVISGLAFLEGSDFFYGTGDCDYILCLDEWPPLSFLVLIGIAGFIFVFFLAVRAGAEYGRAERAKVKCLHCGAKWWREDFMGRHFCLACQKYFK